MLTGNVEFDGARVASNSRHLVLPMGWITHAAQPARGDEECWLYVVREDEQSEQLSKAPVDPLSTDNDPLTGSSCASLGRVRPVDPAS